MRKVVLNLAVVAALLALAGLPAPAVAAESASAIKPVEIFALQTTGNKYVQLHGLEEILSLDEWYIEYRTRSGCSASGNTKKPLAGYLAENDNYLVQMSSSVLSKDGGMILLWQGQTLVDSLIWGTITDPVCEAANRESIVAYSSSAGSPLVRVGSTGDNKSDFRTDSTFVPSDRAVLSPPPQTSVQAVAAAAEISIELSELYAGDSSDRPGFIELRNTGQQTVSLAGFALRAAGGEYLLEDSELLSGGYLSVRLSDTGLTLASSGGVVSLVSPVGSAVDTVEWPPEVTADASIAVFGSGWELTTVITPGAANVLAVPESMETARPVDQTAADQSAAAAVAAIYPAVEITELLPDPASPQTDADDEYIELHNPHDFDLSLAGYQLRAGKTLGDKYTLPELIIPAGGYLVVKSSDSRVALANTGSTVAIFDPLGVQLDTVSYPAAAVGVAYAKSDGVWSWTTTSTPAAVNSIIAPATVIKTAAAKKAAASATKAKAAAKASTAKSAKKAAAKKTPAVKKKSSKTAASGTGALPSPGLGWLLFALAGITIGYIIYEFRYDIQNYYHKLRGHQKARGDAREVA